MKIKANVILLLMILIGLAQTTVGQGTMRAKTESGKDVILYPDGTWKYALETSEASIQRSLYNKLPSAKTVFRPARGEFAIWYDESKWQLERRREDDGIAHFRLLAGDAYAMVIAEELAIPIESLKKIALQNAKEAATDSRVVSEESRIVNGKEILCMQIEGTVEKIPFTYYGYYYGGKQGTIQVITFTGQNLFTKYQREFTDFLNGLEIH